MIPIDKNGNNPGTIVIDITEALHAKDGVITINLPIAGLPIAVDSGIIDGIVDDVNIISVADVNNNTLPIVINLGSGGVTNGPITIAKDLGGNACVVVINVPLSPIEIIVVVNANIDG